LKSCSASSAASVRSIARAHRAGGRALERDEQLGLQIRDEQRDPRADARRITGRLGRRRRAEQHTREEQAFLARPGLEVDRLEPRVRRRDRGILAQRAQRAAEPALQVARERAPVELREQGRPRRRDVDAEGARELAPEPLA
jgi:hypothetical protein